MTKIRIDNVTLSRYMKLRIGIIYLVGAISGWNDYGT